MVCPRCGNDKIEAIVGIAGSRFQACTVCHLPADYFPTYKKVYHSYACPVCDGLAQLPYTESRTSPVDWGPCLYCHPDEYRAWRQHK